MAKRTKKLTDAQKRYLKNTRGAKRAKRTSQGMGNFDEEYTRKLGHYTCPMCVQDVGSKKNACQNMTEASDCPNYTDPANGEEFFDQV